MNAHDGAALERALLLFGDDELGCFVSMPLFEVEHQIAFSGSRRHERAERAIRHVHHDLWQAAFVVSRLEWMREMVSEGRLDQSSWGQYSQIDIEFFMIQLRSIMDYSAVVIDCFAPKPKQLPVSFGKLRDSLVNYSLRLPRGVEPLVRDASWFDHLRVVRNALVHEGAQSVVFPGAQEGILFQVYGKGLTALASRSDLMFNENVVYFERYSAWLFAHILSYLDALGSIVLRDCVLDPKIRGSRSYCPGFAELRRWMGVLACDFASILRSNESAAEDSN